MAFTESEIHKYKSRLLKKTIKTNNCWFWIGAKASNGYGQMQASGRVQQAHRVSYQLFIGEIPTGLTLDHICMKKDCVNPKHLRPMTMVENSRIGNRFTARKACHKGHVFIESNTYIYRGYRCCRLCKKTRDALYRIRHRDKIN